ncbi:MAG: hypothetical protein ACYCW6_17615, partial [Candidatus Xenobia bacterium]
MRGSGELPQALPFVGRADLLALLHTRWSSGRGGVLSMQGLGGIGKTSLVRRFIDDLPPETPGFVWSFYSHPDGDRFLSNLAQAAPDVRGLGLVHAAVAILQAQPAFLLVLDGLERLQNDSGHVIDACLDAFLTAVSTEHALTLVTTRIPLALGESVPVPGLPDEAARLLLGSAATPPCGGHPLVLRLTAGAAEAGAAETLQGWLQRLALWYREHLPATELATLNQLCLFRQPMSAEVLAQVFYLPLEPMLDSLARLAARGLIQPTVADRFTVHPVVREMFLSRPGERNLDEVMHHLLTAGKISAACLLYWDELGGARVLALQRAEYSRGERLARELLGALHSMQPADRIVWDWRAKLHNDLAICLDQLGSLEEAARHYLRALRIRKRQAQTADIVSVLLNLSENAIFRGQWRSAERAAQQAQELALSCDVPGGEAARYYRTYALARQGQPPDHFTEWVVRTPAGTFALVMAELCLLLRHENQALSLIHQTLTRTSAEDLRQGARLLKMLATWYPDMQEVENLLAWARRTGHCSILTKALLLEGRALTRRNAPARATLSLQEALRLARQHGLRALQAEALLLLAGVSDRSDAEVHARAGLEIAEAINDSFLKAAAQEHLSPSGRTGPAGVSALHRAARVLPLRRMPEFERYEGDALIGDSVGMLHSLCLPVDTDLATPLNKPLPLQPLWE